jgi:hypothetical protein
MKALEEQTLGPSPIHIEVFVAEISDEFILGIDILHSYDTSVDLGRHMLRMGQKELSLWSY